MSTHDPYHTERRLEGLRQLNLQLAAARAGRPVPTTDTSIIREEHFALPKWPVQETADPLERYLQLEPWQDACVAYARVATGNELRWRGVWV